MGFYIHIDDPTYHGAEFPFGRRLGPFNTKNEAVAQAVADMAGGAGEGYLGVWAEKASEKTRDGSDADPTVTRGELAEKGAEERRRLEQERADQAVISDPDAADKWGILEAAAKGNQEMVDIIRELKGQRA